MDPLVSIATNSLPVQRLFLICCCREGNPEPRKCARPPPPPPMACLDDSGEPAHCIGRVDELTLNDTKIRATGCHMSGWVSAAGYAGPAMVVQPLLDGEPLGDAITANIHRQIAGDHGFVIPFACDVAHFGNHTFSASAKINKTSPDAFIVGEMCTSCTAPPAFCHKIAC
eukprot:SAG31_NODE_1065_length_10096_cov_7.151530_2_plen_170_part_00